MAVKLHGVLVLRNQHSSVSAVERNGSTIVKFATNGVPVWLTVVARALPPCQVKSMNPVRSPPLFGAML